MPEPELTNTPRINQLVHNGKLMLSLEDAISLGLENNLALAVERYVPWLDQANLLYAKSGANAPVKFDPTVTSTLSLQQPTTPINNPFFAGVAPRADRERRRPGSDRLINHTATANSSTRRVSSREPGPADVRQHASVDEPGLRSFQSVRPIHADSASDPAAVERFRKTVNERYIIEAKNTVKVGESQFAQQVMTTITQVANDYWELVYARENVKVEQVAVAADQQLYENNKKQLEIGTMAPLDVITAQSQLATDQQALVQAQTTQLQDETTLLNAITKDPLAPELAGRSKSFRQRPIFTPTPENISLDDAVHEAWQKRPELQQAELNLKNAGVEVKATKNLLLPQVNLFAQVSGDGLDGKRRSITTTPTAFAANLMRRWSTLPACRHTRAHSHREVAAATSRRSLFSGAGWARIGTR